jgi:hypothetical protein
VDDMRQRRLFVTVYGCIVLVDIGVLVAFCPSVSIVYIINAFNTASDTVPADHDLCNGKI